ncbi:N-acetyltransferase [Niallia circulans]|jgi:[ribosomal protein S5]-alanine N-acetyltransferase|uniref:Acetyltransferase n=3 Tax=Niallia circulans TaxID=1397 RepID=A0A0J1IPT7_NIACI|nr:GNAT family protein [Niallia circulans]KLV27958.1 acetyltransferase [Niallia circulans]MDR4314766.1 GNAT family N-acetyltransferase [Niallia circulans]MED4242934.1 GNAT family protein [Niallia circulans]MED4246913.1 GNAT family protein [Niallia circulans]MED5102599.1 GNAT family protein [Niallia circulans]
MFPILETERLLLREIEKEDAGDLFAYFSNKEVMQYYGQEAFTSIEQVEALIGHFSNNFENQRGIRWGMQLKGTTRLIGTLGLNNLVLSHKRAEIGYEIHPEYGRSGYTAEAVQKVVSYALEELHLNRVGAMIYLENEASNKLIQKLGFQHEGVLRKYYEQNGKAFDINVYSILKDE